MADAEVVKALSGLLNGIAQRVYYGNSEITEELLKDELYPGVPQEEFRALYDKMKGLLKSVAVADMDQAQLEAFLTAQTRKHGGGGMTSEQAAALARFWKGHRGRVREPAGTEPLGACAEGVELEGGPADRDQQGQTSNNPVALVELELGRNGQDSEFVCLEFDEVKINQVLKKMAEIQESIDSVVHHS